MESEAASKAWKDPLPAERVGFFRRLRWLLVPPLAGAVALGIIWLLSGERTTYEVGGAGLASLLGAGTTVIFGKAVIGDKAFEFSLGTWDLAFIVMFVNCASSFFYAYNVDLLQKLPKIGPALRHARRNATVMLKQRPWIRRWATVGVGLFVLTPLPGSGALGGAIVGRIIGVTRFACFVSVSLAGLLVSGAYALLAEELKQLLDTLESYFPAWVRIGIAGAAVVLMAYLVTKLVKWLASMDPTPEELEAVMAEERAELSAASSDVDLAGE
jgi:uncharacterized membrane protein